MYDGWPELNHTRRQYLQTAGLAGLGLLAGCSRQDDSKTTNPDATVTPPRSSHPSTTGEYDQVVDVVEAGADPNGEQSVTPVLESAAADDTLLTFPPGTYAFDSTWRFDGLSNLGVVGDRATLVPASDLQYWLIGFDVADFRFEGFTLDHRGHGVGPQVQIHATGGKSVVRDLSIRGFHDSKQIPLIPNVETKDSSMLVERLRIPDGTQGVAGVYLGPKSLGSITFADCHLEGCAQGIYASAHSGPFVARGGTYVDNNKAAIRIGAGSHGARIEGVHVRVANPQPDRWTSPKNIRGLWLREGMDTLITDCTIELLDLGGVVGDGAILIGNAMGATTIRDTTIRVDDETYAIRAQVPSASPKSLQGDQGLPEDYHLTCENVHVSGSADTLDAIRIIGRDGSVLRNVTVDQPKGERRGLVLAANASETTVEGGSFVTGHYPVVVEADRATLAATGCPVRLKDVERLEATNLGDVGSQLAVGSGGEYCVDGAIGVENATEVVIAVASLRDGTLFGKRMDSDAYQRPR